MIAFSMACQPNLNKSLAFAAVLAATVVVIIDLNIGSERAADRQNQVEKAAKATRAMAFVQLSEGGR
jgi:hypothetical protein